MSRYELLKCCPGQQKALAVDQVCRPVDVGLYDRLIVFNTRQLKAPQGVFWLGAVVIWFIIDEIS